MPIPSARFLFVINPVAGGQPKADFEQQIRTFFSDKDYQTEFYILKSADDSESIKYWINTWKPGIVVAVGGDGTLKAVAELLMNSRIKLGLLPAGSSNGMSKELGFPEDFESCLNILTTGTDKRIDVVKVNNEISLHLSDIGFNAHLVKYFEKTGTRGKWGYIKELGRVMLYKKEFKVQITIDGKSIIRRAFMVVLANASRYGTGALINPEGDLSDGFFEVVILRKISPWEIIKMFFKSHRLNPEKTEILSVKTAKLKISHNAHFQVDGEYLGKTNKIEAKIEPGALNIIVPDKKIS